MCSTSVTRPKAKLGMLVLLSALALAGCRSLPSDIDSGESSYALAPAVDGPLAELSKACEKRVANEESCFLLLHRNDDDLRWRLELIDSAQVSLNLQTFIRARDFSDRLLISRMLHAGFDVYEMEYQGGMQSELYTPPIQSNFVSLHAKAAVVDRRHAFIGSFNFSPRSREFNTEMGILVDSAEFGEQVALVMERSMSKDNAWQLGMSEGGELRWISEDGKLTTQPS